jgi:hypothetical protein
MSRSLAETAAAAAGIDIWLCVAWQQSLPNQQQLHSMSVDLVVTSARSVLQPCSCQAAICAAMLPILPAVAVAACRAPFPKLNKLDINCPIKQLVFGTRGSYRCMLVEQKPLTAHDFR